MEEADSVGREFTTVNRREDSMQTMGTLWMLVAFVAMASPALGSTHGVNCAVPGQTITKALKTAQPGDTIRVRGTCEETVTITTDRVTLNGGGKAILQGPGGGQPGEVSHGLLNIVGVQGVEIRGFTVQHSAADGINGRQGAAFTVRDVRVFQSADDGIESTETSTVRFLGTCAVRGSGEDGLAITRGSSALFSAERVTTDENTRAGLFVIGTSTAAFDTGRVHTAQNTMGVLTLGHSSLTLGRNMPTLLAEENTLDGILVADTSDLRLDGGAINASLA
jgi:nitrous oxidase accessory protein NosD